MAVKQLNNELGTPPLTYGVWIEGRGWLRDPAGRHFADPRIEYAKAALKMWKVASGPPCRVELIDESMVGLQGMFIERERLRDAQRMARKDASNSIFSKIRRLINGLLRHA